MIQCCELPFDVSTRELDHNLLSTLTEFGEKVLASLVWRENIKLDTFESLSELFKRIDDVLEEESPLKCKLQAQIFRFCRNACAYSESNREAVGLRTTLGNSAIRLIKSVISNAEDKNRGIIGDQELIVVQCAFQMLYNSLSTSLTISDYYVNKLNYLDDLLEYVKNSVHKIAYFATISMLRIYKLRLNANKLPVTEKTDCLDPESAYTVLYTKALCTYPEFLEKEFGEHSDNEKLTAIQNIAEIPECHKSMTNSVLMNIMEHFKKNCEAISTAQPDKVQEEFIEELKWFIILLVNVAGLEDAKLLLMQEDEQFVTDTVILLCKVHEFGKAGVNCFTPVEKLDYVAPTGSDNTEIKNHPTFVLKTKLLTLVTYLCSKHQRNQNIVLEKDGISVILECTKIDARNPFIPQYAILALRCLLEGNTENQLFVKQMNKKEFAQNSILKDFGIEITKRKP